MAEGGAPRAGLQIALFGGFRVWVDGRVVPDDAWRRRKPGALVKLLALAPGHRLHREQAMDVLWPELDPGAAAANLRKALHHARRALGGISGAGAELIASSGETLSLSGPNLSVDIDAFLSAAAHARRSGDPDAYAAALDVYGDGLLPEDRYEEWAHEPREQLRADFLALLEELAGLLESRGELDACAAVLRRLVAADPLVEEGHARLIRLYALAGRRTDALRQYERLRKLLASELGTEPSAETQWLFEEVRAKRAAEPELTAELWERVGDLRVLSGDAAGAVKAFALALEAGGADGATIQRKTAAAWLMQQRPDEAESHLRAAEAVAPDSAERGRLACVRANQRWEQGDLDGARAHAQEALDLGLAHGTPEDVAAAHEALAAIAHMRGDWREGLHLELQRLDVQVDDTAALARVFDIHHCIGQFHLYGDGLLDDVEGHARRTLGLAEESGAARAQAFAWCLLGESLLLQARWHEAAGCLERSCELHASFGSRSGALPWVRLAELEVCRGEPEKAAPHLRQAAAIATVSPMAKHLWGRIHATTAFAELELGDAVAAARSVRSSAASACRYGDCPTCSALLNPIAAETFAALVDVEEARMHAENAARVAGFFESSAWRAMAASAVGSLAAAEDDPERARAAFEEAATLYERARQPYWHRRSLTLAAAA